jgi:MinD superfamily P-loop ATPase
MKKILVISGKGGTGKTILTASFASIAKNKIIVDCDVDAANLYLLLNPVIRKKEVFMGGNEAEIDQEKCTKCGRCVEICRFEAINVASDGKNKSYTIDPLSCEGCGACFYGCPAEAISLEEQKNGDWFISDTSYGPFVFAKLDIAAENSGRLVSKIKEEASKLSRGWKYDYTILDGPPGIGCPVIASLAGVDLAVLVTEPTLSGMSDVERVMKVAEHFGVETKVVINKYDINIENSKTIEDICANKGIQIAGKIPFSENVPKSIVKRIPYVEFADDLVSDKIREVWANISKVD